MLSETSTLRLVKDFLSVNPLPAASPTEVASKIVGRVAAPAVGFSEALQDHRIAGIVSPHRLATLAVHARM